MSVADSTELTDDEFHEVVRHYLLAEPERQIEQLGRVETLLADAERVGEKGQRTLARVNYELAAKIEIYNQNKEGAEKCLRLAEKVTDKEQDHRAHKMMLGRIDDVLRISNEYHRKDRAATKEGENELEMGESAESEVETPADHPEDSLYGPLRIDGRNRRTFFHLAYIFPIVEMVLLATTIRI